MHSPSGMLIPPAMPFRRGAIRSIAPIGGREVGLGGSVWDREVLRVDWWEFGGLVFLRVERWWFGGVAVYDTLTSGFWRVCCVRDSKLGEIRGAGWFWVVGVWFLWGWH